MPQTLKNQFIHSRAVFTQILGKSFDAKFLRFFYLGKLHQLLLYALSLLTGCLLSQPINMYFLYLMSAFNKENQQTSIASNMTSQTLLVTILVLLIYICLTHLSHKTRLLVRRSLNNTTVAMAYHPNRPQLSFVNLVFTIRPIVNALSKSIPLGLLYYGLLFSSIWNLFNTSTTIKFSLIFFATAYFFLLFFLFESRHLATAKTTRLNDKAQKLLATIAQNATWIHVNEYERFIQRIFDSIQFKIQQLKVKTHRKNMLVQLLSLTVLCRLCYDLALHPLQAFVIIYCTLKIPKCIFNVQKSYAVWKNDFQTSMDPLNLPQAAIDEFLTPTQLPDIEQFEFKSIHSSILVKKTIPFHGIQVLLFDVEIERQIETDLLNEIQGLGEEKYLRFSNLFPDALRKKQVHIVSNHFWMDDASIRENLVLHNPYRKSDAAIWAALESCGHFTRVMEVGGLDVSFSLLLQKLNPMDIYHFAIARALLSDRSILVLPGMLEFNRKILITLISNISKTHTDRIWIFIAPHNR